MLPDGTFKSLLADTFAQINHTQWQLSELYVVGFRDHGREAQLAHASVELTKAEDAVCKLRAEVERLLPMAREKDRADAEAMTDRWVQQALTDDPDDPPTRRLHVA